MNKEEYINQLRNNLSSLTDEEKESAIEYYSDYFDEANDDQKVIAELGSPEELAKSIIEKLANALVDTKKSDSEEKDDKSDVKQEIDALYYEFSKNSVKNLFMNFSAADVVMISGNKFSVETRGITEEFMNCHLSDDGTLTINNSKRLNFSFWSHDRNKRVVPRILVTIPENMKLEKLRLFLGAGNCRSKEISLACENGTIDVGAGNLQINSLDSEKINVRCGMGNISYQGSVKGHSNIDCGMGNVSLTLKGNPSDYSYDIKLGLGDFKFNNEKKSGVCKTFANEVKENHFSVNCGMGSVSIKIQ